MLGNLLEKFEDVFKPISDEEADKRLWPRIVGSIQDLVGDENIKHGVSEDQIHSVLYAIALDPELREDVEAWVEDTWSEFVSAHEEDEPE